MIDITNSILFQFIAFLVVCAVVGVIVIREFAKKQIFVTFLARNQIAFIEGGDGNPIRMIGNPKPGKYINGFKLDPIPVINGVPDLSVVRVKPWWEEKYGLYVISINLWKKIKEWKLLHERASKNIKEDTKASDWVVKDPNVKEEWFILDNVIHSFLVLGIELKDGFIVNALVQVELGLRQPLVSLYDRINNAGVASFYEIIGDSIRTALDNALQEMTYKKRGEKEDQKEGEKKERVWLTESKGVNDKLCQELRDAINKDGEKDDKLIKLSGYEAISLFIPTWDLSSSSQQDLALSERQAEIERNIAKLKAESENAEFLEAMKAAKAQFPNAPDSELIAMVTSIQKSKNIAKSNLTVYAESGASLAVAAQPGNKPSNPKKRK